MLKEIPNRPLLDGSESVKSPSQSKESPPPTVPAKFQENQVESPPTPPVNPQASQIESPPQTDKPPSPTSSANPQAKQVESPPQTDISPPPTYLTDFQAYQIEKPSFNGPGASWEKDETLPAQTTPLGASEEEKDVLET